MSETAKRKGPPTKAELIEKATAMGYGRPGELQQLTVKQIRELINQTPPQEPLKADDDLPRREPKKYGTGYHPALAAQEPVKVDMDDHRTKEEFLERKKELSDELITEIREPNCGHIFRKVREIHKNGNIIVNICNICGWRETVK